MGAVLLISSLMVCKLSGRKMDRSFRLVIRRVFDGGVGCCNGGMLDRSRLRDFFENLLEALEDRDGICGLMFGDVDAIFVGRICVGWVGMGWNGRERERERVGRGFLSGGESDVEIGVDWIVVMAETVVDGWVRKVREVKRKCRRVI